MKTSFRKTACAALAGAVFISMTGCSIPGGLMGKDKSEDCEKEIKEATEDYCDAIKGTDVDKIIDLSADDLDDRKDELEAALDFDGDLYSEDMGAVLQAITDTITYEIDEDSIDVDEDEGQADVTFTLFNYRDAEFGDDIDCAEAAADFIEEGETYDIKLTVELENTDDGWKIKGTEDITSEVYEFLSMGSLFPDFSFAPSYDLDPQAAIDTIYAACDALESLDMETYYGLFSDDVDLGDLDEAVARVDFSDRSLYSEDLERLLVCYRDAGYYEVDEDSLVIDEEAGTAQIDVTFYVLPTSFDDEEVVPAESMDDAISYLESLERVPVRTTFVLEMTDDGWLISETDEGLIAVTAYLLLGMLGPDFVFEPNTDVEPDAGSTVYADGEPALYYINIADVVGEYGQMEYDPQYDVRLVFPDHYLKFMDGGVWNLDDWDGTANTGYVSGDETDFWAVMVWCTSDNSDLVDLTGYSFVIDHDGDISTVDAASVCEDSVIRVDFYRDENDPEAWCGNYTITLTDPWGRTLWEAYVEVA
jgi:hypothetical protein